MAGGTHAFDMIKRMKENESLRKLKYFKRKEDYRQAEKTLEISYKTGSVEERELLRNEVRRRRTQETRSKVIMILTLAAITIAVVVLVWILL